MFNMRKGRQAKWMTMFTAAPSTTSTAVDNKPTHGVSELGLSFMQATLVIHDYSTALGEYAEEIYLSEGGPYSDLSFLKHDDYLEIVGSVQTKDLALKQQGVDGSPKPHVSTSPGQAWNSSKLESLLKPQVLTNEATLVIRLGSNFLKPSKEKKNMVVISLAKPLAEVHGFKANQVVNFRVLVTEKMKSQLGRQVGCLDSLTATSIELAFKDQFVSRRDMFQITQHLNLKTVYKNQQFEFESIRTRVRSIQINSKEAQSAMVSSSKTRFSFFSKSCQVYMMVEVTREMYEFDEDGYLQLEKCLLFIRSYFERCRVDANTHEVVIIFYGRLFYPQATDRATLLKEAREYLKDPHLSEALLDSLGTFQLSKHTKIFQDVYMKVGSLMMDNIKQQLVPLIKNLRERFNSFPSLVNWKIDVPANVTHMQTRCQERPQNTFLPCNLGISEKTNLLEAINLALFNLNNEEIDQNLKMTGTQLILLTAGQGTYRVNANIVSPTKQRCLLGGIPVQIISFARKPPYKTPLLINCCSYSNPFKREDRGLVTEKGGTKQLLYQGPERCKGLQQFFLADWLDIKYLYSMELLETHLKSNMCQSDPLYGLSKTNPLSTPTYGKMFQQTRLRKSIFQYMRTEKLFQPHPALNYLERMTGVQRESQQDSAAPLKAVKRNFVQIDPLDYKMARPVPGLHEDLEQMLDKFDNDAVVGVNPSHFKQQDYNPFETNIFHTKQDPKQSSQVQTGLPHLRSIAPNPFKQSSFLKKSKQGSLSMMSAPSKSSSYMRRWGSYLPQIESTGYEAENTQSNAQSHPTIQAKMDGFWRSLCEPRLLPLTTSEIPEERQLNDSDQYKREEQYIEFVHKLQFEKVSENMCLRLTQNFQLVSKEGTCDIKISTLNNQNHLSMAFRDRYVFLKPVDEMKFQTKTYYKIKDISSTIKAQFYYMLWNNNDKAFQVKSSAESRLYSATSLNNLDEVQNDLKEAVKCCVKLPEINLVLFYKPNSAEKPDDCADLQIARFKQLRDEIVNLLSKLSQGKRGANYLRSMKDIQVRKSEDFEFTTWGRSRKASERKYREWPSNIQQSLLINEKDGVNFGATESPEQIRPRILSGQSSDNGLPSVINLSMTKISEINATNSMPSKLNHQDVSRTQSIVYIDKAVSPSGGEYLMEHDSTYVTSACFHMKLYWIFARGPVINEMVIKRLMRRVKEISNGSFKVLPISGLIRNEELNPFESSTILRLAPDQNSDISLRRRGSDQIMNQSLSSEDLPLQIDMDESYEQLAQSHRQSPSKIRLQPSEEESLLVEDHEELFSILFPQVLVELCNFVLESKSTTVMSTNFLEAETGLTYVRVYEDNCITFCENDIVAIGSPAAEVVKSRQKIQSHIIALDLLIEILTQATSTS